MDTNTVEQSPLAQSSPLAINSAPVDNKGEQLVARITALVAVNKQHIDLQAKHVDLQDKYDYLQVRYTRLQIHYHSLQTKYDDLAKANSKLTAILNDISALIDDKVVRVDDTYELCCKLWHETLSEEERKAIYKEIGGNLSYYDNSISRRSGEFYANHARLSSNEQQLFWENTIYEHGKNKHYLDL